MTDLQSKQAIFAAKVEALHAKYIVTLAERRSNLRRIRQSIGDRGISIEQATDMRHDIHKTAGTAASFGYRDLTRLAAKACSMIEDFSRYRTTSQEVTAAVSKFMFELDRVIENKADQDRQATAEF